MIDILRRYKRRIIMVAWLIVSILMAVNISVYASGAYSASTVLLKSVSHESGLGELQYILINPVAIQMRVSGMSGSAELSLWLFGLKANGQAFVNLEKKLGKWCVKEAALNSKRLVVPPC